MTPDNHQMQQATDTPNIAHQDQTDKITEDNNPFYDGYPDAYPPPPDGHVYQSPEPPYAYVPTFHPKRWANLTILPPPF